MFISTALQIFLDDAHFTEPANSPKEDSNEFSLRSPHGFEFCGNNYIDNDNSMTTFKFVLFLFLNSFKSKYSCLFIVCFIGLFALIGVINFSKWIIFIGEERHFRLNDEAPSESALVFDDFNISPVKPLNARGDGKSSDCDKLFCI